MHKAAENVSPVERIKQVIEEENSVHDYKSYVPNGGALHKVKNWAEGGAEVYYLTSRKGDQVKLIK